MTYCKTLALLLLLYSFFFHLPQQLNATEANKTGSELVHQTSPAPSPVPGNSSLDSGDDKIDVNPPPAGKEDSGDAKIDVKSPPIGKETCESVSSKCHDDVVNVSACVLPYAGNGPMNLLVQNKGDGSLKFNVTVLPPDSFYNDIEVPRHEVRKMNVYANASITSSVVLTAVNWTCTIPLSVPDPVSVPVPVKTGFSFPSYGVYMTPVNGAYVLAATAFLIGIMWACCKLGKNKRHLDDGVPYQELEMGGLGQQQSTSSSVDVETANAWDQDWDDDWDDEKAVRSPSGTTTTRVGNRRVNGGSSRFAEPNGWEDD